MAYFRMYWECPVCREENYLQVEVHDLDGDDNSKDKCVCGKCSTKVELTTNFRFDVTNWEVAVLDNPTFDPADPSTWADGDNKNQQQLDFI